MKPITKTGFAALVLLLAISCKKESTTIPSSVTTNENATQAAINDNDEFAERGSVTIGSQVWMKKDLTTSHYRNGDTIPEVRNADKWAKLTTGAWCWYKNNPAGGKLYNWYAVHDSRGLAPEGWHVPSNAEWTTLTDYLGGEGVAGGKMKETGMTHWLSPNTDATNSSGFTGLPGGYRNSYGPFNDLGYGGYWWSSTESSIKDAWGHYLDYATGLIYRNVNVKRAGFSVRCLRD